MFECKPISQPLANHFKLLNEQSPKTHEEFEKMNKLPYVNIVGSIMYFMVCNRPVLVHGINILSRFLEIQVKHTDLL